MTKDKSGGNVEELKKKARQLEVAATVCKVNAEEVLDDIADSMETANKLVKALPSKDETYDWWARWWVTFLEEWNAKCFRRCLANVETHSLKTMREWALWFGGFEALWMVGCDMVRNVRVNELKEGASGIISRASPSQADEGAIWQWLNSFDEAALKAIDLFKENQRQAFAQTLKELREYDKVSLLGKLKRFMSQ